MFKRLFSGNKVTRQAHLLYRQVVNEARKPALYRAPFSVADTVEGRFELILLHLFLLDRYLRKDDRLVPLRRALQETLVRDMDRSLREMGIGDMSVGKQMKKVGSALLGRLQSYNDAADRDDMDALKQVIERNILSDNVPGAEAMLEYVTQKLKHFSELDIVKLDISSDVFRG